MKVLKVKDKKVAKRLTDRLLKKRYGSCSDREGRGY